MLADLLIYRWFLIIEISLFASAICEEIFYRFYLPKSNVIVECIISGLLFSFAHFIDKYTRSEFTLSSYIILFFLSICWLISFKITGSLLPAILGHLLYNLPKTVSTIYQYRVSCKVKSVEISK
ncbi:CPBP family intramembrane glutamic endopeptidase [Anoxybacillus sp. J5B_2022]|uniref:CPBP family intramembrane glutamic endopeptidase n=1 Tax=Anoxybacillus sp. J5B_2022 TaxID=3003246 RepID=UPI002286C968|nr:CPBP family intramembrane glutamic endopeptidase [Anoxybacillus sp. J5B_2022]MCZ0756528.1 CPBP family intramembrane metalloprotease [Anoxybacillus sp. J5B_2022]